MHAAFDLTAHGGALRIEIAENLAPLIDEDGSHGADVAAHSAVHGNIARTDQRSGDRYFCTNDRNLCHLLFRLFSSAARFCAHSPAQAALRWTAKTGVAVNLRSENH